MGTAFLLNHNQTIFPPDRQHLYNQGDECTTLTGGWQARAQPRTAPGSAQFSTGVSPVLEKTENMLTVTYQAPDTSAGTVETARNIDLTGYKRIGIRLSLQPGKNSLVYLGVLPRFTSYFEAQLVSVKLLGGSGQSYDDATVYMDVAAIMGAYNIALNMHAVDTTTLSIYEMWLEA